MENLKGTVLASSAETMTDNFKADQGTYLANDLSGKLEILDCATRTAFMRSSLF
jgi:hypothetical protein